jgi:hypothetical protein
MQYSRDQLTGPTFEEGTIALWKKTVWVVTASFGTIPYTFLPEQFQATTGAISQSGKITALPYLTSASYH